MPSTAIVFACPRNQLIYLLSARAAFLCRWNCARTLLTLQYRGIQKMICVRFWTSTGDGEARRPIASVPESSIFFLRLPGTFWTWKDLMFLDGSECVRPRTFLTVIRHLFRVLSRLEQQYKRTAASGNLDESDLAKSVGFDLGFAQSVRNEIT